MKRWISSSSKVALKRLATQLCPPLLLPVARSVFRTVRAPFRSPVNAVSPHGQDLEVYWDPAMEQILETWGEGNVWLEVQFLLAGRRGRVLDIACGTGKTMEILSAFADLEVHGCDISDRLIDRAKQRGIAAERLHVGDATRLPYPDDAFDYSYSIGSLEHFTEDGIVGFLKECRRVTRHVAFHQHPISRSGHDDGWIKTMQSYFNNSVDWWLVRYQDSFERIHVLDSHWEDDRSVGKWFVCIKQEN